MVASIVAAGFNPEADFCYIPDFLPGNTADRLMPRLWAGLQWGQQAIILFGRSIPQPRLTSWYGDPDANYAYSGLQLNPLAWHPDLLELRCLLQEKFERGVNSVLANAYRDGRDSMGWHADDEKELGPKPFIASLSLGASRRFLLREKRGSRSTTVCLQLAHGSLLVMQNNSQSRYRHALPKTAKPAGPRINLTFRQVFKL
jgi:alkylated DNA repair dioxygenase AlkB